MRDCELCGSRARMHCESDQANLCWDCDEKVHGDNFLVAKHSRSLLCHACHEPTPWKASGPKLTPTVSVCEACADFRGRRRVAPGEDENDRTDDEEDDESEEESSEDEAYGDSDEDGENQVVPWSFSSSSPPILDGASSSSEGQEGDRFFSASKICSRSPEMNADLDSDDETASCGSIRSLKRQRLNEGDSVRKINHDRSESSRSTATILGIRKLSRDQSR